MDRLAGSKDAGIEGVILKIGEHYKLDEKFIEHVNNAVSVWITLWHILLCSCFNN